MFSALLKNNKHLSAAQSVHQFTLQKNQEFFDGVLGFWVFGVLGLGVYSSAGPISHAVSCGGLRSL